MEKYICLLRGINVGGNRKIKMADLRSVLSEIDLENVKTYIQSGNIYFESKEKDYRKLETKITNLILDKFGHEVPVMVRQSKELKSIFENNPYLSEEEDLRMIHVAFLSDAPTTEAFDELDLEKFAPDKCQLFERAIYIHYPEGSYKSKLTGNFLEKKLKLKVTARNWKTVLKLVEMIE